MDKRSLGILLILGGVAAYLYYQNQASNSSDDSAVSFLDDPVTGVTDMVTAAVSGWQSVGDGAIWVPQLNAVESQFGIPQNLLARIAYEESHFRPDIITGATASPAGALGLMQLEPAYFASVRVPRPFQSSDTLAQIQDGAQDLVTNYNALGNWPQAVAAYNAGLSTIQTGNASAANKAATVKYVADILADVPNANV
jgi:soluble lytic murein transglycosylase-like protein